MIDKYSANKNSYVTGVKVLDVEKRYKPGPKHYVYVIQVTWSNPTNIFIIYRRYAQFFDLQCKLLDLFAEAPSPSNNYNTHSRLIPFLPGKIFLGRSQIRQVALERKQALNIYCQTLISLPERISRSRCVLEFFQPLPTDVQNQIEFLARDKKTVTKSTMTISGPSKLPTYRCLDDFVAIEKTEMSLRRNTLVQVIHKHLNGWWFVQNGDQTGFVPGAFLEPIEQQRDVHENNTFPRSSNETYVVNKSYEAKSRDEISLDQGSFVTVLEKSFTGWWIVNFNNMTGQFPAVFLTSCKGRIIPANITKEESTIPSNTLSHRLSSLNSYEQDDHDENPNINNEPEIFYVHSDFIDNIGDCVSLQRGDVVEIHDKHSSGWWLGRRLKDDYILTWIPSAFLQKEPIFDAYGDSAYNPSSNTKSFIKVDNEEEEQRQQQVELATESIYQNVGNQISTNIVYTEVIEKKQSITIKHSFLPSSDNEEDSTRASVRDLVKKFNRH
ncbi:unnamed protein product [Rotaria sp. Silwood2]|nr:unnamed protein product [Rotaria sp. Silwood2]CAF2577732.1 unnamed protein product [Rotaria sp. Silwood2]